MQSSSPNRTVTLLQDATQRLLNWLGSLICNITTRPYQVWDPAQSDAWNRGYDSFNRGTSNPHQTDSDSYAEWLAGFQQAIRNDAW